VGAYPTFDVDEAASALEWWRDAGVDTLVDDAIRDWFAAPPAKLVAPADAPPAPAALPPTMAALAAWRLGPDAPENGWSGVSLASSGPADAKIMVLIDCPEREDGDAGALLSGAAGRRFDRMLAAIGLNRDEVHLAAICARRPIAGKLPADVAGRLGEIARHLVELAAPERLLLLGDATSRAVLSAERRDIQGRLQSFNHKNGQTMVVASLHPRLLLDRPVLKAESWRDLQLLMGERPKGTSAI
jgi:DNA polymerase